MLAEAEKLGNVTSNVSIFRDREGDFYLEKKSGLHNLYGFF